MASIEHALKMLKVTISCTSNVVVRVSNILLVGRKTIFCKLKLPTSTNFQSAHLNVR